MQWFRFYHDTVRDQKIERVARKARCDVSHAGWAWMVILDYASQAEDRGSVAGLDAEFIAITARMDEEVAQAILDQIVAHGMVRDGRVAAWDKRQRISDDVAARVRKHRGGEKAPPPNGGGNERKANGHGAETPGNVGETLHGGDPWGGHTANDVTETVHNANVTLRGGDVTLQSEAVTLRPLRAQTTDLQKEESKKESPPSPPWGDGGVSLFGNPAGLADAPAKPGPDAEAEAEAAFERFKAAYPKRNVPHTWGGNSKTGAKARFLGAVRKGTDPEMLIGAAGRYAAAMAEAGKVGTDKVADARTWLNQERWDDWKNVHEFRGNGQAVGPDGRSKGDRSHPPVGYDDVARGTRVGWWTMTSTGWQRMAG